MDDGTPIWVSSIKEPAQGLSEYELDQLRIAKEKKLCQASCLPIALAASKKLKVDYPDTEVKVFIGLMGGIDAEIKGNKLKDYRKDFLSLKSYSDFGKIPFHAWVEISDDQFKTSSIVDLTYSFPNPARGSIDNFSRSEAKKRKLKHIPILTNTEDVKSFFYYLLRTELRSQHGLDKYFEQAVNHLD
ncbi:hypothetical protein [Vibrio jasicida]|uniref:hypothetical protein n=1 Tax=Vibrio jasicida TaxID=766224 RepID=UPI0005ED7DA8|nr:hypothetical protein [Vibrio jasicida]